MSRLITRKSICFALMMWLTTVSTWASTGLKVGQEKKSKAGVEKLLALSERQHDTYWVANFVRDGNCPEESGKCSNDLILVRGPGGTITIPIEDASQVSATFSEHPRPFAAVISQIERGGYAYANLEVYAFATQNKPQSILKTPELLVNNLEGAACVGKQLCAESKLTVNFMAGAQPDFPDIILRQTGTAIRADGKGIERIDLRYIFNYNAQTKLYSAKR